MPEIAPEPTREPIRTAATAIDESQFLLGIMDIATMSENEIDAIWTLIRFLKRKEAGIVVAEEVLP